MMSRGSRAPMTKTTATNGHTFTDTSTLPTIPHSKTVDLPHSRKMIVVQAYSPQDNRGLLVLRGETVQIISQEGEWYFARNEKGKEGFVPSTHLLAPYTSMRSRQSSRSNPIRPVASGSSIHDLDSSRTLSMYPCRSADRPRRMSQGSEGDGRGVRRILSPPNQTQVPNGTDLSNNNNNFVPHQGGGGGGVHQGTGTTPYEQKYSPSSSSGVASLNGPSSPSYTSLHQSTSQENVGHHTSSSHTHSSQSSLSSMSQDDTERSMPVGPEGESASRNGVPVGEDATPRTRATSESNLASMKIRPLPLPPKAATPTVPRKPQHIYSTIPGEDEVPPPIPPRTYIGADPGHDQYSQPADALQAYNQERVPRFNYPRVKSLTDVRGRELKQSAFTDTSNGLYSPVFQPRTKTRRQRADYARGEVESVPSESGRVSMPSRWSSSRKSGSRASNDTATFDEHQQAARLPDGQWRGEERETEGIRRPRGETTASQHSQTRIAKFRKCLWGLYIITENFEAMDENEVSVKKGEHVSVWNQDDREWFWVVRHTSSNDEGFVPSHYLREIVAKDTRQNAPGLESVKERGLPTHQSLVTTSHFPMPDTPPRLMRCRVGSQEMRRRPSSGGSTGRRGRLNSDSSSRPTSLSGRTPSISSIEKTDIPESPPSSPPPPYTEVDQNQPRRHYSLSQQHEPLPSPYGGPMTRTRSNTQVSSPSYRSRAMGHVMPLSLPEGESPTPPLPRRGSRDLIDPYQLRSPTVLSGGTLV